MLACELFSVACNTLPHAYYTLALWSLAASRQLANKIKQQTQEMKDILTKLVHTESLLLIDVTLECADVFLGAHRTCRPQKEDRNVCTSKMETLTQHSFPDSFAANKD